jgi:hypothetical protein
MLVGIVGAENEEVDLGEVVLRTAHEPERILPRNPQIERHDMGAFLRNLVFHLARIGDARHYFDAVAAVEQKTHRAEHLGVVVYTEQPDAAVFFRFIVHAGPVL